MSKLAVPNYPTPDVEALSRLRENLVPWSERARAALDVANSHKITDDYGAVVAAENAKAAHDLYTEVERRRKETTEIFRVFVSSVNDAVRPISEDARAAKDRYKSLLTKWQLDQERIAREREEAARKEAMRLQEEAERQWKEGAEHEALETLDRAEDVQAEGQAAATVLSGPIHTPSSTSSLRRTWSWRVVDLGLVPRNYLMVDEAILNSLRAVKPRPPEIPGIEWTQDVKVVVR